MGRGFLAASLANSVDEAIVVVKRFACEDTVTYLRVKRIDSRMDAGGEGWNMRPSLDILKQLML
jgi:hypothetical protein